MSTPKEVHIYRNRHVFHGDQYAGQYNFQRHTLFLLPALEEHARHIAAGVAPGRDLPKVEIGEEALEPEIPLEPFPAEIEALKSPTLGYRTPEVILWAHQNLSEVQWGLRYPGEVQRKPKAAAEKLAAEKLAAEKLAAEKPGVSVSPANQPSKDLKPSVAASNGGEQSDGKHQSDGKLKL